MGTTPTDNAPLAGVAGVTDVAGTTLRWGRRYLMCRPTHFRLAYAINPWMDTDDPVDPDRAMAQWEALRAAIVSAGGTVDEVAPVPGLPDMVFTANHGVVDAGTFHPGAMRHPERTAEVTATARHLAARGMTVTAPARGVVQEGTGDALPFRGGLVAGHGPRSTPGAHAQLRTRLGAPVTSLRLTDPRWYHADLVFCPLDDRSALVVPEAVDGPSARRLAAVVPDPIVVDLDEAATFCQNAIVIDRTVLLPACPPRVGRELTARGFTVAVVAVNEFVKAGGAIRCLTLPLDVDLAADRRALGGPPLRAAG